MKKIIYLLLILFSLTLFSQPFSHSIKFLGSTYNTAKANYCQNPNSTSVNLIVNIDIRLPDGLVYRMNVDRNVRYYKIKTVARKIHIKKANFYLLNI